MTIGEREKAAQQCTKILPLPPLPRAPFSDEDEEAFAIAESMMLQALSAIFEMEEEVESSMERR